MPKTISQYKVGGYDENFSYVIWGGDDACAVVDPAGNTGLFLDEIVAEKCEVSHILITHSHFDHVEGIDEVLSTYPEARIVMHPDAVERIEKRDHVVLVYEGSLLMVGNVKITVLHTPGHISDAVCYYITEEHAPDGVGKVVTGDTLFVEGCGRTSEDDAEILYRTLGRLRELPESTEIYAGHDYGSRQISTIAWEKEHNRFFLAPDLDAFLKERFG